MKGIAKKILLTLLLTLLYCVIFIACDEPIAHYSLTYSASTGGYLQGELNQIVENGESGMPVIAIADEGYIFFEWSDGVATAERKDINIQKNLNVFANFKLVDAGEPEVPVKPAFLTVTYETDGNGYIDNNATQTIIYGENAETVTAVPNTGYEFLKWSDNNSTEAVRTDTNITASISATAEFNKISFSVVYETDGNGYIDNNATQTIVYGENAVTVTAVPDTGYEFLKWSDNNSTEAVRSDTVIAENIRAMAIFKKCTYSVQYDVGTGGYLIGEQNQTVAYGENATEVVAMVYPGYMFTEWSDNYGFHERIDLSVKDNLSVSAQFVFLFGGGDGTEENPLLIDNYDQLLMMNIFPESHYRLNADLDLKGVNHLPMFHIGYMFNGSFDGGGKIIKNFTVNRYLALPSLFGSIGSLGSVKNLYITNFSITVPNYNTTLVIDKETVNIPLQVGAVAGISMGTLTNISVSSGLISSVKLDYKNIFIGGLVGRSTGIIENCHTDTIMRLDGIGTGNGDNALNVGGLVGLAHDDILFCSSKGAIDLLLSNNLSGRNIGGLIGVYEYFGYAAETYIIGCNSSVDIAANGEIDSGGLISKFYCAVKFYITNCYALGNIIVPDYIIDSFGGSYIGGFVSVIISNAKMTSYITNCYATGNLKGGLFIAGFATEITGSFDEIINISYCYSSGKAEGHNAAGFVYQTFGVNFYRSYALGDVYGASTACGFANSLFWGEYLEECFAIGNIFCNYDFGEYYTGFIWSAFSYYGKILIKNCYSKSNIYLIGTSSINYINVSGFISNLEYACVFNCFYAGEIFNATEFYLGHEYIYGFAGLIIESEVANCHFLKGGDFSDIDAYGDLVWGNGLLQITKHETIAAMIQPTEAQTLADMLNDGEEDNWVYLENDVPKLKFFVNQST